MQIEQPPVITGLPDSRVSFEHLANTICGCVSVCVSIPGNPSRNWPPPQLSLQHTHIHSYLKSLGRLSQVHRSHFFCFLHYSQTQRVTQSKRMRRNLSYHWCQKLKIMQTHTQTAVRILGFSQLCPWGFVRRIPVTETLWVHFYFFFSLKKTSTFFK